jgi:transcription initiation factor TFIIB
MDKQKTITENVIVNVVHQIDSPNIPVSDKIDPNQINPNSKIPASDKCVQIYTANPSPIIMQPSTSKSNLSKTKKKKITHAEKTKLWTIFDNDTSHLDKEANQIDQTQTQNNTDLVIVYSKENDAACKICGSNLMIMEDGFPACMNQACATIYRDTLDYSPEWRFYGADDKNAADPTRCGNPINPLLVESSYGCKVLCSNTSSYDMKKIRKWTEWQSMPHREKSLYDEFQFITTMAQNSGIPKIFIDDAMVLHKDISEQQMFRGMNRDSIKAASIYISCRKNGCPRTAHEIAEIFHLDKTSATTGCSMAVNIMYNIERSADNNKNHNKNINDLCNTKPSLFIDRYCSRLNINKELTMLCKFIAKKIEEESMITDNTPHAIAAGIIYFTAHTCKLNITKIDIKAICGVSEVTINKCFRKMDTIKSALVPEVILKKYSQEV